MPDKILNPELPLPSIINSSALPSTLETPLSAVLICIPTPKSFAVPTPNPPVTSAPPEVVSNFFALS